MNVCMVLYPNDVTRDSRVLTEARRLVEDGHRVVVVCDYDPDRKGRETINGVEVVRLQQRSNLWHFAYRAVQLLLLIELRWYRPLYRLHREIGFDVLHVHDLPLARTGLLMGRRARCCVVLDLHENYPVFLQGCWPVRMRPTRRMKRRLFYGLGRWRRYERSSVRKASHVIVTTDAARQRIIGLGVPEHRVTTVGNLLQEHFIALASRATELGSAFDDRCVVSYLGSMSQSVRIDTAVRSMPMILESVPNAHLLLAGQIENVPECRALAKRLGVEAHVTLEEWQPRARVPAYMQVSQIGLLPFEPNGHMNEAMSHKLFQYMYMGRPVVASECAAMAQVITETGCGVVVEGLASDAAKLAEAVIRLARDPVACAEMGARGKEAVMAKYRWEGEGDRLAAAYRSMESVCWKSRSVRSPAE